MGMPGRKNKGVTKEVDELHSGSVMYCGILCQLYLIMSCVISCLDLLFYVMCVLLTRQVKDQKKP